MKRTDIELKATYSAGAKIVMVTDFDEETVEYLVIDNRRNKKTIGTKSRIKMLSFQSNFWRKDWNIDQFIQKTDSEFRVVRR